MRYFLIGIEMNEVCEEDNACIKVVFQKITSMPSIGGCMDASSYNYNPYATFDDGTCYNQYESCVEIIED